jgi:hypothetical protein
MSLFDDIHLDIQANKIPEKFKAKDLKYNLCEKTDSYLIGNGAYKASTITTNLSNLRVDADGSDSGFHVKQGAKPLYVRFSKGLYALKSDIKNEMVTPNLIKRKVTFNSPRKNILKNLDIKNNLFDGNHLSALKATLPTLTLGGWAGGNIKKYGKYLKSEGIDLDVDCFPEKTMSREDVFDFISNDDNNTFNCCVVILAWGGMNRKHAIMAMSDWEEWKSVAEDIRFTNISRSKSYQLFDGLRAVNKLKGMGPAYFTKLIFFLSKKNAFDIETKERCRGYIMDQWTARSMNLLLGSQCIKLNSVLEKNGKYRRLVKDTNTASIYDFFCNKVEELATLIGYAESPEIAEEFLFSIGRGKGEWRNYVVSNDKHDY